VILVLIFAFGKIKLYCIPVAEHFHPISPNITFEGLLANENSTTFSKESKNERFPEKWEKVYSSPEDTFEVYRRSDN